MEELFKQTKQFDVLYIEDHKEGREITAELLKKFFNKVYVASSYKDAIQFFDNKIDILITDISLPFKSGIEIAKELKELKPNLKIIFISAYSNSKYKEEAKKLNAQFLNKPFSLEEFIEAIKKTIAP